MRQRGHESGSSNAMQRVQIVVLLAQASSTERPFDVCTKFSASCLDVFTVASCRVFRSWYCKQLTLACRQHLSFNMLFLPYRAFIGEARHNLYMRHVTTDKSRGKSSGNEPFVRSIQNDFAAKIQAQKMLAIFDRFGDLLFVRLLTLDAGSHCIWVGIKCMEKNGTALAVLHIAQI